MNEYLYIYVYICVYVYTRICSVVKANQFLSFNFHTISNTELAVIKTYFTAAT